MSAPASDLRVHLDFWQPALSTALSPREAYLRGEVPGLDGNSGTKPVLYALLGIRRRAYVPATFDDSPDVSGWALTVFGVGRTVGEAAWALNKVTQAFEHQTVTIGGYTSTPCRVDPGAEIGVKDGTASGSITLTYTL